MAEQNGTAQQAIEMRNSRKEALFVFAAALGFDPKNIRTINVEAGQITVTQFVRVNEGEKLRDDDGNTIVSVHALRIHASEIVEQEKFNDFLEGKPVVSSAAADEIAKKIRSKMA